jgi:hypothetical protein
VAGWQPGRLCGLGSPPPLPPLLSNGDEVHGAGDESTAAMSRSDGWQREVIGAAAGSGARAQGTCI